jgi:hypothetical protein
MSLKKLLTKNVAIGTGVVALVLGVTFFPSLDETKLNSCNKEDFPKTCYVDWKLDGRNDTAIEYDLNGAILSYKSDSNYDGIIDWSRTYEQDDKGNTIRRVTEDHNSVEVVEYKRDQNGELISSNRELEFKK